MNNIITINNLYFRYKDSFIFDGFNLEIVEGSWVTIAGKNASGKSTLVKLLAGILKSNDEIKVDKIVVNDQNIRKIRRMIGFVFENPDNQFVGETVRDNLAFGLENLEYKPEEISRLIDEMGTQFNILDILDKTCDNLSGGEKEKVAIASVLIIKPKILVIDEGLAMIDEDGRKEIFNILSTINKEKQLTIINITHDLKDSYYSNRLIIMQKGVVVIDGKPKGVLKHDRILNRLGIEIPFIADLSNKLSFYGILDDVVVDIDEMVGLIWK